MYPFIRLAWQISKARRMPPLGALDTHVSTHYCLPWDIDFFMELNNGRTLTMYDLGRIPFGYRAGLIKALSDNSWGLTMAGASVRYRRRVRMFEKLEMRSRVVWWDQRFIYIEQSMWKQDGECANHILYRSAITDRSGIVDPQRVVEAMGLTVDRPEAPVWVASWIAADADRPWPPQ